MLEHMRRILVTGGAGFIGSHLVDELLWQEHQVMTLDNLNDAYNPDIKIRNMRRHLNSPNFSWKHVDIRDKDALNQIFSKYKPEIVVHLAALVGVRPSVSNPYLYEAVNINGTMNLLEAAVAHKTKKFIFASSSSVYGINDKVPFAENDPLLKPISPYAATKIAGEALCHSTAHLFDLPTVALRFFTVYGPRQRPDLAIHKFTGLLVENKPLPIFGDGTSSRDYTYIDDIIQGICSAINYISQPYEVFNLGNSKTVSLQELISKLEYATGRKAQLVRLQHQPGDVPKTWADLTKAQKLLNYQPNTTLEKGLTNFVKWYIPGTIESQQVSPYE